jgi:RNA polymerase sigma-70 factor (ECF subfamily)
MAAAAQSLGLAFAGPAEAAAEVDAPTLQGCRRGEPAALRRFVLQYQRQVFAFFSRMLGQGPHVEDLAQEVFVKAYQALPRFEPDGPAKVSTWVLGIASRVAIDWRRRERVRLVPLDEAKGACGGASPEDEASSRELARAFEAAAGQLDDAQRAVFVLAEFHGLSMAELAATLGIPENTAKTRLFRARDKMRALLGSVREA